MLHGIARQQAREQREQAREKETQDWLARQQVRNLKAAAEL